MEAAEVVWIVSGLCVHARGCYDQEEKASWRRIWESLIWWFLVASHRAPNQHRVKPESRSGVFGGRPMKLPWIRSGPIKGPRNGSLGKVPAVKTCTNGPGLIKLSSYSGNTPYIFSKRMNPDNWLDYLDLGYRVKKLAFQHAEVINSISCSMLMKHLYLIRHACIK